jgi:Tripartite tricarboxylate transporter family receptor
MAAMPLIPIGKMRAAIMAMVEDDLTVEAVSFFGGFRTPALAPVDRSVLAGNIRAGNLRALAVTTASRSPALPDIPAMMEFLPGYEASVWNGLNAPKNTPVEIVRKLNGEINAALTDYELKARLAGLGSLQALHRNLKNSWSRILKSGPRSSEPRTSRRTDIAGAAMLVFR